MKQRVFIIGLVCSAVLLLAAAGLVFWNQPGKSGDKAAEQVIAVNEIAQLARAGRSDEAAQKAEALREQLQRAAAVRTGNGPALLLCGLGLLSVASVLVYVYVAILRPFDKLDRFAEEIARGNFELALDYERRNYFGAFTWAFDSMRREITKARACEREAVENNKTVIATLSHDIKTPIASIRAYAEGLEANLDNTPERRERYVSVLMRKCDEVSKLTDDLFLHSLSDLDRLKIEPEVFEVCAWVARGVEEIAGEQGDVRLVRPNFTAAVAADPNRLLQVLENLVNNARKYAGTEIEVGLRRAEDGVELWVRDYGAGILDEDMPFIFDKFYRGRNCGGAPGSGLGLYIVRYVMERMGGRVALRNQADGLEAVVFLPLSE